MQEIRPGGLIVKLLSDGRNGYIRRRELSWDRRAQAQLTLPAIGALIEAKIIDDPSILHYVPLSVRQLSDPCQNAKGKYLRGQTVRGEVVNVRLNGVYVQIEPGIDAFLPTEEYPIPPSQSTEFFPLIGDQIAATITIIDEGNHQIHLSVLQRLRELNPFTFERRKMFLLDQFMETVNRPLFNAVTGERASQHRKEGGTTQRYRPPLPRFDSVLVVDDEDNYLLEL